MGCDYFYSGNLPDPVLQEKVVRFAASFWEQVALWVEPTPDKEYLTTLERRPPLRAKARWELSTFQYPFNFYGIVPLFDDGVFEQGQFVFDRSDNGALVRFRKLPASFNLPPIEEYYQERDEEVIVKDGGYSRRGGDVAFALLLEIIRLRWWPELDAGDDYNVCSDVAGILANSGMDNVFLDESLDLRACYAMFEPQYDKVHSPAQLLGSVVEEQKPKLRLVLPNAERTLLDNLELSVRTSSCLKKAGFTTVGEVLKCTPSDLEKIPWFGRKSLHEITEVLDDYGLYLQPEADEGG